MFVSFDREVTPVWFKLVFAYGGIDVLEMTVILLLPIIIIIMGEEKEGNYINRIVMCCYM